MEKQGRSGILFRCFKEHTKIGLDICAGTCYNIVRKCGHRTSASISAFQAEEVGSIPIARSMQKSAVAFWATRFCFALSVPLIAQGIDLVGKLGKVFVCAALVVLDDPQQALAGADQPLEHTGSTALASFALCSMRMRMPSCRHTAPSAPMAHCAPL